MDPSPHILVVDDHREIRDLLGKYLAKHGYRVTVADGGAEMKRVLKAGAIDLVVLDLMMPGEDGLTLCRDLRATTEIPVIMLTAMAEDTDRVVGLEIGADDYVTKPCSPRELVARLRAILRRVNAGSVREAESAVVTGALRIEPAARTVTWRGAPLELTSTEFNLLEQLAREAGRVVSKEELSERALARKLTRYDRSIDVHMSHLRAKLGELPDGRSPIQTIRGRGYQLIAEPE